MTPDMIVTIAAGVFIMVGGVASALGQTKWVQDRPSYARLLQGVQLAAGRLSMAIPPGTTAVEAEALVAKEAVGVAMNYADSAKVTGASQAAIGSMIAGELGKILPAGHIVAGSPDVTTAINQLISDLRAQVLTPTISSVVPTSALVATSVPVAVIGAPT